MRRHGTAGLGCDRMGKRARVKMAARTPPGNPAFASATERPRWQRLVRQLDADCVSAPSGCCGGGRRPGERAQRLLGWRCSGVNDTYAARLWTVDYEDVPVGLGYEP